jgi:preprotein translocase subunit SecG
MMYTTLILSVHIVVAFTIIGLVLIQHGKGADAGAAFGGGGGGGASGSVFGAQGSSNFLSRTTGILAAVFFVTSLSMAYLTTSGHEVATSLMDESSTPLSSETPAAVPLVPIEDATDVPADVPGANAPAASMSGDLPSSGDATNQKSGTGVVDDVPSSDVPGAPK